LASASDWGSEGRRFKSCRPDSERLTVTQVAVSLFSFVDLTEPRRYAGATTGKGIKEMAGERASRGLSKRRRLFNDFSESLRAQRSDLAGKYLCPICLDGFERSSVEGDTPDLTLEHVIPDGLGERLFVLTCKNCNNNVGGTKLDTALHHRANDQAFLRGEKAIRSVLQIGEARLAIDWRQTLTESGGKHNDFHVIKEATSPAAIDQSEAILRAAKEGPEMTLRLLIPNPRHAQVALLKVGYLIAFLRLGYQFILSTNLESVREQIRDPSAKLLPVDALVVGPVPAIPLRKNTIAAIRKPAELESWLSVFELKGVGQFGVLLPSSASAPGYFDRAGQHRQRHGKMELKLTGLQPIE